MNIGIFGGTFDPVHRGHLAVARAAQRACKLGRIYFVPADLPPHKRRQPITAFEHRYAMLALALRDEERFVPSLIEAQDGSGPQRPNYSIETVRRFRSVLPENVRLFFILGIDMFQNIGTWHKPDELMREAELIVVSRPGYKNSPPTTPAKTSEEAKVHWLTNVAENVSSTRLRQALASGRATRGLLDPAVAEYIRKEHLYRSAR